MPQDWTDPSGGTNELACHAPTADKIGPRPHMHPCTQARPDDECDFWDLASQPITMLCPKDAPCQANHRLPPICRGRSIVIGWCVRSQESWSLSGLACVHLHEMTLECEVMSCPWLGHGRPIHLRRATTWGSGSLRRTMKIKIKKQRN